MEQVKYFKGCSSLSEVNATLLHIFNTKYKEPSKRDSTYEKILKEHMYLVCTTQDIKSLCGGNFHYTQPFIVPEKEVHFNTKNWLTKLAYSINNNGGKLGSVYFQYIKEMKSLDINPKKEDLELIAKLCNYNPGWLYYKCKELNIK